MSSIHSIASGIRTASRWRFVLPVVAGLASVGGTQSVASAQSDNDRFQRVVKTQEPVESVIRPQSGAPISEQFVQAAREGFAQFPRHIQEYMQAQNVTLTLVRFIDESEGPVKPLGNAPFSGKSTWRNTHGLADRGKDAGVIAERREDLCTGKEVIQRPAETKKTVKHEGTHAFESSLNYEGYKGISDTPEYIAAYQKDVKALVERNQYVKRHIEGKETNKVTAFPCIAAEDKEYKALMEEVKLHSEDPQVQEKLRQYQEYQELSYFLMGYPAARGRWESFADLLEALLEEKPTQEDQVLLANFTNSREYIRESVLDEAGFKQLLLKYRPDSPYLKQALGK